jgi:uncharacterized protein
MTPRTGPVDLTDVEARRLLEVAAAAVAAGLSGSAAPGRDAAQGDPVLLEPGATFVTLERDGNLLGCIGTLEPVRPLVEDVAHNAAGAAFSDPRLPPVTWDDYAAMSIEISLLSALEPLEVADLDEFREVLRPGIDGLVVEAAARRATFLPAVWRHFGDDADAFLRALWRKAGLAPGAWPDGIRCARYTAEKLSDPGPRPRLDGTPAHSAP